DLLGRADAFAAPEWQFALYRLVNVDAIRLIAGEALRQRTRADVFAAANARGVPLVPINTPDEFADAEQTRARGYFRRTGFAHLGDAPFAVAPFNFSATPVELNNAAPELHGGGKRAATSIAGPLAGPPPSPGTATREGTVLDGVRVIVFGYAAVAP